MAVSDVIEQFLLFKRGENLSPRTLTWYAYVLRPFGAWLGLREVGSVAPLDVALWLGERREAGASSSTLASCYTGLLAFFNWCEASAALGHPASPIGHGAKKAVKRPKRGRPAVEHVRYDEYMRLAADIDLASWVDYRDWCLLGVLYWCGLRRAEVCALDVSDVDLERRRLLVRHGKGDKARLVPVVDDVIAGIATYLTVRPVWDGPQLWLAWDHARRGLRGPLSAGGLRQMLRRRCARAGLRYLRPHAWRHGFGMGLLNAGAEMSSVAAMMGHSSVKVTESIYSRWLIDGLDQQYRMAAARLRGGG